MTSKSKRKVLQGRLLPAVSVALMMIVMICASGCGGDQAAESRQSDSGDTGADADIASMSLDQKICRMFLVRCPERDYEEQMRRYSFGGYILYAKDFKTPEGDDLTDRQVKEKIAGIKAAAEDMPVIAVDEEGGEVTRASENKNLFPEGPCKSPLDLLEMGGKDALYEDAEIKSKKMLGYGINVNLAPVADVPTNEKAFMYERSMGTDAERTAELVGGVVKAMKDAGIGSVIKHFPGYGDNSDTHGMKSEDNRSLEDLKNRDFLPFKSGIEAGVGGIMMSHIVAEAIDSKLPVSLSAEAYDILRNDLGFEGVIITDDVWMIDKKKLGIEGDPAVMAVKAGCDMIISTNYMQDIARIHTAVIEGEISEERIDEAVLRIQKWKEGLETIE